MDDLEFKIDRLREVQNLIFSYNLRLNETTNQSTIDILSRELLLLSDEEDLLIREINQHLGDFGRIARRL